VRLSLLREANNAAKNNNNNNNNNNEQFKESKESKDGGGGGGNRIQLQEKIFVPIDEYPNVYLISHLYIIYVLYSTTLLVVSSVRVE
jgi:hypothetical protein